ncbi:MAG: ATP-binding protein [Cyanobacteria bacterium P01_F01_bin.86]
MIEPKPPSQDMTIIRILLIDDQPIVAESIRRLLVSEPDLEFHYCSNGEQALSAATEIKPTVILQDLVMPDIDGFMLVKSFRDNLETQDIPIIVLSNREDATTKAESFSVGANDYLVKLPDPIELIARVRYHSTAYSNLLRRYEAERALAYNKELEQRVEERTTELREALENLKETQAKLVHNEKMTSLGQLVAGIAHEINNPINFICGNIDYVNQYVNDLIDILHSYEENYPEPIPEILEKSSEIELDFVQKDLQKILASMTMGAQRIDDLVLSLKAFSRLDESGTKVVNIHQGIESTLVILASKIQDIKIIKNYGDLPDLECFPGQLNQVFMNVLENAVDALEEAGFNQESLFLKGHHDWIPEIYIQTNILNSNKVRIQISDNGSGIPEKIRSKIFDAFFTTKAVGKGTGLGLSISHQIVVEKHRGNLECFSIPGRGSTFVIEIPIRFSVSNANSETNLDIKDHVNAAF